MPSSFEPLFAAAPAQGAAPGWMVALAGGPNAAKGGFASDPRFGGGGIVPAQDSLHDRAELDAAYAEGFAAARAEAEAEAAASNAARAGLALSLSKLDDSLGEVLAQRLAQAVAALCEGTMAPFAIDPDSLQRRCVTAAARVGEGIIDASLRLHPADIALLDRAFASTWHIVPDAGLERGSVVFDTAEGAIEDGPAQWRMALEEALLQC